VRIESAVSLACKRREWATRLTAMSETSGGSGTFSRRSFLRYSAVTAGLGTLVRLRAVPAATESPLIEATPEVFSPNEKEILTVIVERMVDSGDPSMPAVRDTHAIATIERTLGEVDESVASQLRWLLSVFEYAPPLLAFRMSTFTGMTPEEQDDYLRGWANSRFQIRRLAFRALKNLSMLGYYAQDSTWRGIHYDGPWVPRTGAHRGSPAVAGDA